MARTSLELSTQDGAIRVLAAGIRSGQRLADMRPNGRPGWTESSHLVDGEGNPCSSLVESQARLAGGLLVTAASPSAEKIRGSSLPPSHAVCRMAPSAVHTAQYLVLRISLPAAL